MVKPILALAAVLAIASPAIVQAQTAPAADQAMQMAPADFAAQASSSNQFELESSTLALEREVGDETRAFAEHMIADHTTAAQNMAPAAAEEGVEMPAALSEMHQQRLDELAALEGEEFEAAYRAAQVQAHEEAVSLFQSYAESGPEGALKDFAAMTLPTLEEHLAHIQELAGAM